jgi:hypothetical protein
MPRAVDAISSHLDSSKSQKLSVSKSPYKTKKEAEDDIDDEDEYNDHKALKKSHKNENVIKVLAVKKPSQNENQIILRSSKTGETTVGFVKGIY